MGEKQTRLTTCDPLVRGIDVLDDDDVLFSAHRVGLVDNLREFGDQNVSRRCENSCGMERVGTHFVVSDSHGVCRVVVLWLVWCDANASWIGEKEGKKGHARIRFLFDSTPWRLAETSSIGFRIWGVSPFPVFLSSLSLSPFFTVPQSRSPNSVSVDRLESI